MLLKKIYLIELLRFISSFSVIIYHYEIFFFRFNNFNLLKISHENIDRLPFGKILDFIYEHGDYGIHIFWTISGFVISYVYFDSIKKYNWKIFFINRFSRLYPLHFITLIAVIIIQFADLDFSKELDLFKYNDSYHFFLNLFFISAWGLEQNVSFNLPIWSVSLEIIVYIVFFITVSKFNNVGLKELFLFYFFLAVISKLGFMESDQHNDLISCIRLFVTGMMVFMLFKYNKKYIFLSLSVLFLIFAFINNFKIFFFCPGLLMLILSIENFLVIKNKKFLNLCSVIGNLTYSSYLIHLPISLILISYFRDDTKIFLSEYFFISYIITIIIISLISYHFIEKKLKKYVRINFLKN
jgi:peptidoglycan/LPS O-acetylase OafA/YrhL